MSETLSDTQLLTLWEARQERARLIQRLLDSEEDRALALEYGRRDPVYWIETFASTYDPRLAAFGIDPWVPFRLYPRQKEYVRWAMERYERGESGTTPKCRGVGVSWVWMALASWLIIRPDISVTVGSRTEKMVDDSGDMDALLPKVSGIIDHLPAFARDFYFPGWDSSVHHTHKKIAHPSNGSMITGEVGKNMGRGGRSALYIWDEAAHHDHARKVDRAVSMNTNCLMEVSTPNGTDNPFAQKVLKNTVPCFWLRHDTVPHYDAAWLEHMRATRYAHDPVGFAQEILVDFEGSSDARAIPAPWVEAARTTYLPRPSYAEEVVVIGCDVSTGGDRTVAVIRQGPRVIGVVERGGDGGDVIAGWLLRLAEVHGARVIAWDAIGVGEGVSSALRLLAPQHIQLIPVVVSQAATRTWWPAQECEARELFGNLRAELYWTLRERFRRTAEDATSRPQDRIWLPEDAPDALIAQLGWIRQASGGGGKIVIERKEALKKRTGASPDLADALMIAYASDVIAPPRVIPVRQESPRKVAPRRRQRIPSEW